MSFDSSSPPTGRQALGVRVAIDKSRTERNALPVSIRALDVRLDPLGRTLASPLQCRHRQKHVPGQELLLRDLEFHDPSVGSENGLGMCTPHVWPTVGIVAWRRPAGEVAVEIAVLVCPEFEGLIPVSRIVDVGVSHGCESDGAAAVASHPPQTRRLPFDFLQGPQIIHERGCEALVDVDVPTELRIADEFQFTCASGDVVGEITRQTVEVLTVVNRADVSTVDELFEIKAVSAKIRQGGAEIVEPRQRLAAFLISQKPSLSKARAVLPLLLRFLRLLGFRTLIHDGGTVAMILDAEDNDVRVLFLQGLKLGQVFHRDNDRLVAPDKSGAGFHCLLDEMNMKASVDGDAGQRVIATVLFYTLFDQARETICHFQALPFCVADLCMPRDLIRYRRRSPAVENEFGGSPDEVCPHHTAAKRAFGVVVHAACKDDVQKEFVQQFHLLVH